MSTPNFIVTRPRAHPEVAFRVKVEAIGYGGTHRHCENVA
jgi:hypothetical protein